MAAGNVILAHDSGGPKMDIVVDYNNKPTGFRASDVDGYAYALKHIFSMNSQDRLELRQNARESLARFSEEQFELDFLHLCEPLFKRFQMEMR